MSFLSYGFFFFVFILLLLYYLLPNRYQWKVLLAGSFLYYFLLCGADYLHIRYMIYLIVTILSTYVGTCRISDRYEKMHETLKCKKSEWDRAKRKVYKAKEEKKAKLIMVFTLFLNFGMLAFLKCFGPHFSLIIPIGISFYTFQTMGYVIDVYQEKVTAEKNLFKVALFTSFFPQIIQGPIAIYDDLAQQLYESHRFDLERTKRALLLLLWGFFKKLVIADRAVLIISQVTADSSLYQGKIILFTVILYSVQLYTDFSGGIDIVRAVGELFGITMAENFRRPYFSSSLTEYWHRWHITLGNWMRSYVFYPLSISKNSLNFSRYLSKKGHKHLARVLPASLASVITFLIIGVWHGTNGKYIAFGLWNGVMIMIMELLSPWTDRLLDRCGIRKSSAGFHIVCIIWTYFLVLIGYYFDIAIDYSDAISMIIRSFTDFSPLPDMTFDLLLLECGLSRADLYLIIIATLFLFLISLLQETKGIVFREWILSRPLIKRWLILYICMFLVLLLGMYGPGINAADFVYMQF